MHSTLVQIDDSPGSRRAGSVSEQHVVSGRSESLTHVLVVLLIHVAVPSVSNCDGFTSRLALLIVKDLGATSWYLHVCRDGRTTTSQSRVS